MAFLDWLSADPSMAQPTGTWADTGSLLGNLQNPGLGGFNQSGYPSSLSTGMTPMQNQAAIAQAYQQQQLAAYLQALRNQQGMTTTQAPTQSGFSQLLGSIGGLGGLMGGSGSGTGGMGSMLGSLVGGGGGSSGSGLGRTGDTIGSIVSKIAPIALSLLS